MLSLSLSLSLRLCRKHSGATLRQPGLNTGGDGPVGACLKHSFAGELHSLKQILYTHLEKPQMHNRTKEVFYLSSKTGELPANRVAPL